MARVSPPAVLRDSLSLLRRFVRNPGRVGSIVPSSGSLASAVLRSMRRPGTPAHPLTVVELGAGTGAFTRQIVPRLRLGDRFMAVEVESEFVDTLRRRWPNVDVVCASAEHLSAFMREYNLGQADHIVSGLPFATLPAATTRHIVAAVADSLHVGGTFSTFHYVHSYRVPAASAFRREMSRALHAEPTKEFVGRNFPPAFAVTWTKGPKPTRQDTSAGTGRSARRHTSAGRADSSGSRSRR